jgi:hypothetical protein
LVTSLLFTNLLPILFKGFFHYKNWTVGKEILYILSLLITIATLNYFIGWQLFFENQYFQLYHYLQTLLNTFIIAIFPIFIAIALNLITSQQKVTIASEKINNHLNKKLQKTTNTDATLVLKGNGKYESLTVNTGAILFIESAGNYSDIYYVKNNVTIKKTTFRSSLQELENQLIDFSCFYRSHRSFIVNINQVIKSNGNAQGYQLSIKYIEDKEVPVSRTKISGFNAMFEQ